VGIVTPVGTDTAEFGMRIRGALSEWHYDVTTIKLSDFFGSKPTPGHLEHEDDRVKRLIKAGNEWAREAKSPFGVAPLAIHAIGKARRRTHVERGQADGPHLEQTPVPRHAYVLHSLKRPGEVDLLRLVYGSFFFLFATQASEEDRKRTLMARLATRPESEREERAVDLMKIDALQTDAYGQAVQKTYHEADVFIGDDKNPDRAVSLIFGDPRIAPRIGEHAMYLAEATSAASLSTSRRVGAAIVSADGRSIVSVGKNEVPEDSAADSIVGFDYSERAKRSLVSDMVHKLAQTGWLSEEKEVLLKQDADSFEQQAQEVLTKSAVGQVIEFQRPVHAEMWAILDATRRGIALQGTEMYCTTFPCHLCWKHIPESGIQTTYFIEPYPKSQATAMYEQTSRRLKPFVGVAPRAYMQLFSNRHLPEIEPSSGMIQTPNREKSVPISEKLSQPEAIPGREEDILSRFQKWMPQ
jgi:cytidine deaminase